MFNLIPRLLPLPREKDPGWVWSGGTQILGGDNKINVADVLKIDFCSYLAKCREEQIMFLSKEMHKFNYFICYHL